MEIEYEVFVVTKRKDRLDAIVFRKYGHLDFLEEILELNIKVIGQQVFLPQGMEIKLPMRIVDTRPKEVEASKLW